MAGGSIWIKRKRNRMQDKVLPELLDAYIEQNEVRLIRLSLKRLLELPGRLFLDKEHLH